MFELKKLCNSYENMTPLEKGKLLTEKSAKVLVALKVLDIPGVNPIDTLAAFIIGAIVSDGVINEKEYLFMYPALIKTFGDDFDFTRIKKSFEKDKQGRQMIKDYTQDMMMIFSFISESLKEDIIALCLCILSIDGKISLKEKIYIRKLIKA